MAKSLNKCQFIGNLGKDPETRYAPSGDAICNFSIACSDGYKDKNTGEQVDKTEWVNVVAFRKLAEICDKWLKKGSKVYVEGKMQTRKWQDKEGNDRWSTEILLDNMLMLGGNPQDNQSTGDYSHDQNASQQAAPAQSQAAPAMNNDFDDDIPF